MANIDNELLEIRAASEGSKTRQSIVKALKSINEDRQYREKTKLVITEANNHTTLTGGPWDIVEVKVNTGSDNIGSCISLDDFGEVRQNGYYDLWNTSWPEGHAWKSFTVNVSPSNYNGGELNVNQNGEYISNLDGYDGYSKVKVNVPEGGAEGQNFIVNFFDQNNKGMESKKQKQKLPGVEKRQYTERLLENAEYSYHGYGRKLFL